MNQKKSKKQGWIYFLTCAITFCHINAYAFILEQMLFQAVKSGNEPYFELLLERHRPNLRTLNAKDGEGNTLLHYTSENGFVRSTQILIEAGVDLLPENNEGLTPPHLALREKNRYGEAFCRSVGRTPRCVNGLLSFRPGQIESLFYYQSNAQSLWISYLKQIQILVLFEPYLIPVSRPITRPNTPVVTTDPEPEPEFSPDPPRIIIPDEYVERLEPEERVPSDPPTPPITRIEDIEESVLTPLNFLEFNESRSGPIQFTDLETAIIAGQVDQVQSLLSQGSAPDLLNPTTGETPFDLAVYRVRFFMGQFCNAVNINCTHQNIRQYVFDPTKDSVVYKDYIERTHALYLRTYAIMELLE